MDISCFLDHVTAWAEGEEAVRALVLVGSHARGKARPDSDVDLVLLTADPDAIIRSSFMQAFGAAARVEKEDWGKVTSLRTWYPEDNLEVEFGITTPDWMARPLDEGTRRVLSDGYRILVDKDDCFSGSVPG